MKNLIILVFLCFIRFIPSYSQDSIFVLHPAVGDTIDKKEKIDFELFPEFKNSDFKFGIIFSIGEKKTLNVYTLSNSITTKELDEAGIMEYRSNTEKLQEFYLSQNQKDTIQNKKILIDDFKNQTVINNKNMVSEEAMDKSSFEGRRQRSLRDRAIEAGLRNQKLTDAQNYGVYGEIKFKKKKKK